MNRDAVVAEAVGYTRPKNSTGQDIWESPTTYHKTFDPPPFISAPTWASDGIVGEYLCTAKAIPIRNDFLIALGNIIADRLEVHSSELDMLDWVLEREPGDIAQALLAVQEAA